MLSATPRIGVTDRRADRTRFAAYARPCNGAVAFLRDAGNPRAALVTHLAELTQLVSAQARLVDRRLREAFLLSEVQAAAFKCAARRQSTRWEKRVRTTCLILYPACEWAVHLGQIFAAYGLANAGPDPWAIATDA